MRLVFIIILVFYSNRTFSQSPDIALIKSIYKDSIIDYNRVGGIQLCDSINSIKARFSKIIKRDNLGYHIISDTLKILSFDSFYDENDSRSKFINTIAIESSNFKTKNGICVGMSLKELKEIYPKMEISYSFGLSGEYFNPDDLPIIIKLESFNGEKLGYYSNGEKSGVTDTFRMDGRIVLIELLKECK